MISLLWKEYREHRLTFLLMAATGLISNMIVTHFRSLDHEFVLLLLFIIEGPLFILVFGTQLVQSEVNTGTFSFLASIPVSRDKIWLSKVLFLTLFWLTLYSIFSIIAGYFGAVSLSVTTGIPHGWQPLLLAIPIIMISLSLFTTMLPKGFPTLINVVCGSAIVSILSSELVVFLFSANQYLLIPLIAAICLFASRTAFVQGELMTGWKSTFWGMGALAAGLFAGLCFWRGIDMLADRFHSPTHFKNLSENLIPVGEGKGFIFHSQSKSMLWDPIQTKKEARTYFWNALTGQVNQIGNRLTRVIDVSDDGKYFAAQTQYRWPGCTGQSRLIFSSIDGKEVHILGEESLHEQYCLPVSFTKNSGLVYRRSIALTRNSQPIMEICHYEPGSGTRVIYSYQVSKFRSVGCKYLKCSNSILLIPESKKEKSLLISLDDGKKRFISFPPGSVWKIDETNDFAIFLNSNHGASNSTYLAITKSDEVKPLDWIATHSKVIGLTFEKQPLVLTSSPSASSSIINNSSPITRLYIGSDSYLTASYSDINDCSLFHTNLDTHEIKQVASFSSCRSDWLDVALSENGKWIFIWQKLMPQNSFEAYAINLQTGEKKPYLGNPKQMYMIQRGYGSKFIINKATQISLFDAENDKEEIIVENIANEGKTNDREDD